MFLNTCFTFLESIVNFFCIPDVANLHAITVTIKLTINIEIRFFFEAESADSNESKPFIVGLAAIKMPIKKVKTKPVNKAHTINLHI